jgi:hypothetical protein
MMDSVRNPLYLGAAYGSVAEFVSTAIERELSLRGIQCTLTESTNSVSSTETSPTEPSEEFSPDF